MAPPRPASASTAPLPFWQSPRFTALVLAGAAVLAYANSFKGPFLFDDEPSILGNPTLTSLWRALWPPTQGGITVSGRPLLNFSFAVNHAISGQAVWSYHAINLLIHIAAAATLAALIRRTLRRPLLASRFGPHANGIALVTAAIWTLHPLQTESVTYIVQRAESLCGLMYLLTLWGFARACDLTADAKKISSRPHDGAATPATSASRQSRRWLLFSWVACLLGMFSKEVMVTAPLIVALYDRVFVAGSWRATWAIRKTYYLALSGTWLVLLALVLASSGRGGTAGFGTDVSVLAYAQTQVQAIIHYLRLIVWPTPLVLDYGRSLVGGWTPIIAPLLLLAPLLAATAWGVWRGRAWGFCAAFFFIVLAPSSSVVPVATQTMAEHRLYLPLAAVAVLVTTSLHRLIGRISLALLGFVALLLGVVSAQRNEDYASAIQIYEDTVNKRPDNARAMALLADYHRRAGHLTQARDWLERSLQREPGVGPVLNNLGSVYQEFGDVSQAISLYRQALRLDPDDLGVLNNLGTALILAGSPDEGIATLQTAIRIAPNSSRTRANLANGLARSGRLPEAAIQFEALVNAAPDDADARQNYSNALLALGRNTDAIVQLERTVQLRPNDPDLRNRLGTALGRTGRIREALVQFNEALRLDPRHESARQNAARAERFLQSQ